MLNHIKAKTSARMLALGTLVSTAVVIALPSPTAMAIGNAPSNIVVTQHASNTLKVTWDFDSGLGDPLSLKVTPYEGAEALDGSPDGEPDLRQYPVYQPEADQFVLVAGLTNGTEYRFQVSALYEDGIANSDLSDAVASAGPPESPAALNAIVDDAGDVTVTWSVPPSDNGSPITSYTVSHTDGNVADDVIIGDDPEEAGSTTHTYENLADGTYSVLSLIHI